MTSLLPQQKGYLPYYLLYASVSAVIHTAVCYVSKPATALTQFSGPKHPPANGLLARVYGMKNVYSSLIRIYAAYHITNPELYTLATLTFVGVLFLYGTELVVYKTVRMKEASFPFVTAGIALVWMVTYRDWYLT